MEAIFEGLLLRESRADTPAAARIRGPHRVAARTTSTSSGRAPRTARSARAPCSRRRRIKVEEVAQELRGGPCGHRRAGRRRALRARRARGPHGGVVEPTEGDAARLTCRDSARAAGGLSARRGDRSFAGRFELPGPRSALYLTRTHPFVEGLAGYVVDTALDPLWRGARPALRGDPHRAVQDADHRCSSSPALPHRRPAARTPSDPLLAEECHVVAFEGAPSAADWLTRRAGRRLLLDAARRQHLAAIRQRTL